MKMDVGGAIKAYLKENGLTLTYMAEACGWSVSGLSRALGGESQLRLLDYLRICECLNVPYKKFLEEESK